MKHSFGGAAIVGCAMMAGSVHAQTTVTLYGIADANVRADHTSIGTLKSVGSGGEQQSRWGLRGSEDLGGGLKAIFNFEQGIDLGDNSDPQGNVTRTTPSSPVSSTGSRTFGRRAIVGLSDATWGEVRFGRDMTPYYLTWTAADPWGGGTVSSGYDYAIGNVSRFDNAIGYTSPTLAGFKGSVLLRTGEATATTAAAGGPLDGGDALSASLTYANGPVFAGASYLAVRPSAAASLRITRSGNLVATYDLGVVKLHALGFYTNAFNSNRYFTYAFGVTVPIHAFKLIAVAARVDNRDAKGVLDAAGQPAHFDDANVFGIGTRYTLSNRTDLYLAAARIVNGGNAAFVLMDNSNTGLYTTANTSPGSNPWSMQFGIQHKF